MTKLDVTNREGSVTAESEDADCSVCQASENFASVTQRQILDVRRCVIYTHGFGSAQAAYLYQE
jgi:hypothetical protein